MNFSSAELGIGARVKHPEFGEGIVYKLSGTKATVFFSKDKVHEISTLFKGLEIIEGAPEQEAPGIDLDIVELALRNVLEEISDVNKTTELGGKWDGGTMILKPADANLQSKEIPIENFFHKIVMMRDRLRVLEQNINSNPKLSDEEKVNLQQYISRAYGSMTSFNILFAHKEDQFSSK